MSRQALITSVCVLLCALAGAGGQAEDQKHQYDAAVPKTILELQQFRRASTARIRSRTGREGVATLVNLNPAINTWFLIRVEWKDSATPQLTHIENPRPHTSQLLLDEASPSSGIIISEGNKRIACELFGSGVLDQAKRSRLVYFSLCEGRLYARNPSIGHRSGLESATEFVRDRVWGGEAVIGVFHNLLADRYRVTGELAQNPAPEPAPTEDRAQPLAAALAPQFAGKRLLPRDMGIALEREGLRKDGMVPGNWYAAASPGMWVSVMQPDLIATAILQSYRNVVNSLDKVEATSLVYLIAFDLSQFELQYELGTDHPRVNWSDRVPESRRDPNLPGPDGMNTISPLATGGLIRPDNVPATVAAFIGGFKRTHGAFRTGELAARNHGSHYGFIENGVVLSKLQPGVATVFVLDDGATGEPVGMKTWTEADNRFLSKIRHARQNGVPIIEAQGTDSVTGPALPVPGRLVGRWAEGNWSGSKDEKQRTMRSGLSIQRSHDKNFLIYAVFTDATPSAMARVFQAYQVNYAMLLDMNALEHTYLAVYRRSGGELSVDHLLTGMNVLDKLPSGDFIPRFLGYSDNRDFFYLKRRSAKSAAAGER